MPDLTSYKGSCHCGKVQYEVKTELEQVISCNCSICSRKGHLLAFVDTSSFKLVSGENDQSEYLFNKRHIHHLFCKACGISSFSYGLKPDGTKMYAINVRCLEGLDIDQLAITKVDGKSF